MREGEIEWTSDDAWARMAVKRLFVMALLGLAEELRLQARVIEQ